MSIIKKFIRGAGKFAEEVKKPTSFLKGEEFENYVRENMFPKEHYDLLHITHDYEKNKNDYVESSLNPDLKLRDRKTGKEFYVECKFRNGYLNHKDQVQWCNKKQLFRYKKIHKTEAPVFIALGFGDNGRKPTDICLFSITKGKWTGLYTSFLDKHLFYLDKPVFSGYLWKL
jgi:hypothetical protein